MASWETFCPGFEIVRWDESNAPVQGNLYARQAYQVRKWAFVSDYVRLHALFTQGGIYLDTDVELTAPLDHFLGQEAFCGFESPEKVATCLIGSVPCHPLLRELTEQYRLLPFLRGGVPDCITNVERITALLIEKGLSPDGQAQTVAGMTVYPCDYFSPKSLVDGKITRTPNTCAIHHFSASWMTSRQRLHTYIAQKLGPVWTKKMKRIRNL